MAVLGPSLATILCISGFIDDVNTMAGKVSTHVSDAKRVSLDKDLTSRRIPKLTYHLQPARATKLATDRSIFIRVLDKKTLSKYFNRLTVYYFHKTCSYYFKV